MPTNEYMDKWDVNGELYDIHDAGRGSANGVATLDENTKVPDAQLGKGLANGVASLDENGRIPYSQLPESAMEYRGGWDASTNTPSLEDGTGIRGDFYIVDVAGTQDLGSGAIQFFVNDRVVYSGSVWQRLSAGDVKSVNGVTPVNGNVSITGANIPSGIGSDTTTFALQKRKEFTYIVNSDASLAYWLSNGSQGTSSGGNDFTSVLIKKGTHTYNGTGLHLNVLGTKYVEGEEGASINVKTALEYDTLNSECSMYNVHVRAEYVCGFVKCVNLTDCVAYLPESSEAYSYGFYSCENLINCSGDARGTTTGTGFYDCKKLVNCWGAGYGGTDGYSLGFDGCENLVNCTGKAEGEGPIVSGFRNCNDVMNCSSTVTGEGDYVCAYYMCKNLNNCIGGAYANSTSDDAFGYYRCVGVNNCSGVATGLGSGPNRYAFGSCTVVHGCYASRTSKSGVFLSCYASHSSTSTFACADTATGGFNNTTNSAPSSL